MSIYSLLAFICALYGVTAIAEGRPVDGLLCFVGAAGVTLLRRLVKADQ